MKRDCNKLKNHRFDILIIGGGIHGAATARRLALKGYDVALVEKDDFCQATSFNSLKFLHGGLRYLQHADFKRMRESIRARREFMQLAPHLVHPIGCLMPTKGFGIKGKAAMRVALLLNDWISFDRNKELELEKHLPRGSILNKLEAQKCIPGLKEDQIDGAALWYDALLLNSERMLLLLLHQAEKHGATLANYVVANKHTNMGSHQEVTITDIFGGNSFPVTSRLVINCAGPWLDEVITSSIDTPSSGLAKAVNIVVDRNFFGEYAVGIEGSHDFSDKDSIVKRGKRLFFFVPWQGKTMIGTTYSYCKLSETKRFTEKKDIEEMVAEINTIYPAANLKYDDVVFSHMGLVPAHLPNDQNTNNDPILLKHSEIIDHQDDKNHTGLLSIRGVKYTTALQISRDIEALLKKKNFQPATPAKRKKPASPNATAPTDVDYISHISTRYGEQAENIYRIIAEEPASQKVLLNDPPFIAAEVLFAIRDEMAYHLSDLILRRSGLGTYGFPGENLLHAVAEIMEKELLWSKEEKKGEIQMVIDIYKKMNIQLP